MRANGVHTLVSGLLKSTSMRSALVFAFGGFGFSLATLLLARYLPAEQFGLLALILALVQIGLAIGPAGMDLLINRGQLSPSLAISKTVVVTATAAACLIAIVAATAYAIPKNLLPALLVTVVAAAMSKVAAAFFQSAQQFKLSLGLTQSHNFLLLLTVPVAATRAPDPLPVILWIIALGYCATAVYGWATANRRFASHHAPQVISWRDGFHGLGIIFAVLVLAQTERVLIPLLLSLQQMAEFGVLAAVVIAPFRMLQLAVGYTLLPRLRGARDLTQARRILRGEVILALTVGLLGAVAVFWLGPMIISLLVGDKYDLPPSLFAAAVGVGWMRLAQSITGATVNSLGSGTHLSVLNAVAWTSLLVAVVSAIIMSRYGLIGIVLGVGTGWLLQAVAGYVLAGRVLTVRYGKTQEDAG